METVEDTSITEIVDKCDESSAPTTVTNPNGNGADIDTPLSKREQKKLHKLAQYEIRKKEKRRQDRIKSKEKRAEAAAKGLPGRTSQRKALKRNTMDNSKNSVRVAIDLDYEEQMSDKDIAKCSKQLLWVYTTNRKATMPIHLFYTSLKADSRMQESLSHNEGYAKWDIKFREESYLEAFEKASIVYLTSDSETVLDQLDPNSVYIIGGLVDHNHHKGLSLARAEKHGLKTARLPLGEHVCMKTRTVLTIVHVFDIILRVSQGQGWEEAILGVLPPRKLRTEGRKRRGKSSSREVKQIRSNESGEKNSDSENPMADGAAETVVDNVSES